MITLILFLVVILIVSLILMIALPIATILALPVLLDCVIIVGLLKLATRKKKEKGGRSKC